MQQGQIPRDVGELEALLDMAAERGAKRALASVGLHDEHAAGDVEDLRELLSAWRTTKAEAGKTFVKWLTMGLLSAIAFGVYMKFKGG